MWLCHYSIQLDYIRGHNSWRLLKIKSFSKLHLLTLLRCSRNISDLGVHLNIWIEISSNYHPFSLPLSHKTSRLHSLRDEATLKYTWITSINTIWHSLCLVFICLSNHEICMENFILDIFRLKWYKL